MTEKIPELKPCPFCKKPARSWKQGIIRKKLCACSDNECGAYFTKFTPEEWNTRADASYLVTKKEAAQDALTDMDCMVNLGTHERSKFLLTYEHTIRALLEAASK